MADNKKSFLLYADQIGLFEELPDELAGKLIKHIYRYVNDQDPQTDDLTLKIAFEPIKRQLKRDLEKYESIRERNRENARKRWDAKNATASDRIPPDTKNADNDNDNDTVNDNVNDILLEKETKRFKPPILQDVFDYCILEKNLGIDETEFYANGFFNYYESNGWKVGKNKMKNWKAALSGWINRGEFKPKTTGGNTRLDKFMGK